MLLSMDSRVAAIMMELLAIFERDGLVRGDGLVGAKADILVQSSHHSLKGLMISRNGAHGYRSWAKEKKVDFLVKGMHPYEEKSNLQEYRVAVYFGDFNTPWEAAEFITKLNHTNPEVLGLPPTHPPLALFCGSNSSQ